MKQLIRNNRLVDREPKSNSQWLCPLLNINRSVKVTIAGITAGVAMEEPFIPNANLFASGAGLGSISWIYVHKDMPIPYCLILNELFELQSAPIRDCSVKDSSPISFAYSCQVLHNKEGANILCFYNLFANDMIHTPSETFLSATQSLEMFLGRFCAFALEPCFKASEPANLRFDIAEEMIVGSNCQMIYAEVNTNNSSDRADVDVNLFSNAKMKIEISVPHKEFALSCLPLSIFREAVWDFDRNFESSINCAYAQNIVLDGETSWRVVSDASIEGWLRLCIDTAFVSPLDSSCNELGLECWELGSHIPINSIVELEIGMIMLPAFVNSIINCFRIERKGLPYSNIIFEFDFDCGSVFHKDMKEGQIYKLIGNEEYANLLFHIPPTAKASGLPVANSLSCGKFAVINIKVCNIDFSNKLIKIEKGKGKKDRYVIVSENTLNLAKEYLNEREYQDNPYLFDSTETTHISHKHPQQVLRRISKKLSLGYIIYPHALRHSNATHLIEDGYDLHLVQKNLGHANPNTTQRYVQYDNIDLTQIINPLDKLLEDSSKGLLGIQST